MRSVRFLFVGLVFANAHYCHIGLGWCFYRIRIIDVLEVFTLGMVCIGFWCLLFTVYC